MCKKIIDWCDNHQGFINAILTLLLVIGATTSIYLSIHPVAKEPNIELYTDSRYSNNAVYYHIFTLYHFKLYIYNGGDAPCFDVELRSDQRIQDAMRVIQDIQPYNLSHEFEYLIGGYVLSNVSSYRVSGSIQPQEVIPVAIILDVPAIREINPEKLSIEVICSGDEESISIKLLDGLP